MPSSSSSSSSPLDESKSEQRLIALQRVGKISRSPFFNFVRANRLRRSFPNMRTAVRESGREWREMSAEQKRPYQLEASSVPRNTHVPAYYLLGEHVLGRRARGQLELFKASLDRYVDRRVAAVWRKNAAGLVKKER